jgi:TctA family transporter
MTLYEPLFLILWIDSDVFCLRTLVSVFSFTACSMLSVLRSLISIFIHILLEEVSCIQVINGRRRLTKRVCTLFHDFE